MMISLIVAMTKKRVIGNKNQLPWHISDDLKNFKKLTTGQVVIMGRKTFESIGKPLPNRHNIVISHSGFSFSGVEVCSTIQQGLEKAKSLNKDVFVIGGASIYQQTLPLVEKMYISHIKKNYAGDTFFPEFNEREWEIEKKENYAEFEHIVYRRKA